ncbi:lysoplasmalogenase [Streptomyces sp. HNM0574]|uniref:lysoplasmalogenase n=1 Tax=Streptomyces sp. HNM0574 TaxID=2714954 RepID=UPI00146DDA2B|nr:lysoplasmalogenase [Streptomyces sp. HNM0574]NLU70879.1 lysoplasmalogenase [Streptomyces sp. HNM0574]
MTITASAAGAVRTAVSGPGVRTLLKEATARFARADGHGRGALVAYGAFAAVDLLATARSPRGARRAAKPLLMPALASYALRRRTPRAGEPERAPKALVAGLACATVGDTALLWDEREAAFLTGMAAFLGTQLSYTAGMAGQLGGLRGIRDRPAPALGCLAAWAAANAALAPTLPAALRLPTAGYSLALAAMGAAALGVGGKVAVGAASFLASDLLIGLQAAGHEFPSQEVLIMAGYILGQYLIATGWAEAAEAAA